MHIKGPAKYPYGYTEIATMDNTEQNSLMDFGILKMKKETKDIKNILNI